MGVGQDFDRIIAGVRTKFDKAFDATAAEAFESIVEGSPITGAPGQPKISGELARSWTLDRKSSEATISTSDSGADEIEEGLHNGRAIVLRARTGGFHSVKSTVAGIQPLVDHVVQNLRK